LGSQKPGTREMPSAVDAGALAAVGVEDCNGASGSWARAGMLRTVVVTTMIAAIAEKHLKIVNLIRGLQYRMAIWFRMRRISWGFDSRKMLVRTIRSSTAAAPTAARALA
jgi:hypothetical protein